MEKSSLFKLAGTVLAVVAIFLFPLEIAELIVHIAENLFEMLEFLLDEVIGELFHTSHHLTQVIVFYLLFGLFFYIMYKFWQRLKTLYYDIKFKLSNLRISR